MNFLIINAGCRINGQGGTLSAAMVELAERTLKHHGHCVVVTDLNEPYVVADEVKKILEADVLIFQTPGWWMTTPWQLIKYEDDVFVSPELCGGDGRTRSDPEKKYGSGASLPINVMCFPPPGMPRWKPLLIPISSSKARGSTGSSCLSTKPCSSSASKPIRASW